MLAAQALLPQLTQYNRLIIAYSGGLDSTVLLHCLAELREQLTPTTLLAVHINHGLQANADRWQQHCQQVCEQLNIPLQVMHVDARASIGESPEAAAREARLQAFKTLLVQGDCLLTAHQQDDQAETVLLQLFRGAGVNGLAAMPVKCRFGQAHLLRPLLNYSREQLADYAYREQLAWIDDESNVDTRFERNFIRQQLLPMVKQRWPGAATTLERVAKHQQHALNLLEVLAEQDWQQCRGENECQLTLSTLQALSSERQINLLRYWFKRCRVINPNTAKLQQIQSSLLNSRNDAMAVVTWDNVTIRRHRDSLYLLTSSFAANGEPQIWAFPEPITLSNGKQLMAKQITTGGLVIPDSAIISIRYRQGGERIQLPGHHHHHSLKKLWQQWQVPYWLRGQIPLLYINDDFAAVVGYCISQAYQAPAGQAGWQITYK